MRFTASEKQEIIKLVEQSDIGVNRSLKQLGIAKSTFYKWYKLYTEKGLIGLEPLPSHNRRQWNTIPEKEKNLVISVALEFSELSPRELSCKLSDERGIFISESSVYRILKAKGLITSPAHILLAAGNEFSKKTLFVHEMWQTDFTYFKILGWGWYYLSTIIDDYSRFIVHWELCETMKAEDVQSTVHYALKSAGLKNGQRPILLSDNSSNTRRECPRCHPNDPKGWIIKDYNVSTQTYSNERRILRPGYKPCGTCYGTGNCKAYNTCSSSQERDGDFTCQFCHGDRFEVCDYCKGSGIEPTYH